MNPAAALPSLVGVARAQGFRFRHLHSRYGVECSRILTCEIAMHSQRQLGDEARRYGAKKATLVDVLARMPNVGGDQGFARSKG